MIKIITSKQSLFLKLTYNGFLKKIIIFNPIKLDLINSDELFNRAIQLIQFKNGTFKTTKKDRFKGIDSEAIKLISDKKNQNLDILDIGASDGSTTTVLSEKLDLNGITHQIVATDLYIKILVEKHLLFTNLYDEDKEWIATTSGIFYFSNSVPSWFFLSKMGSLLFKNIPLKQTNKVVLLISPSARTKLNEGKLKFLRQNIFVSFSDDLKNSFDFIRCMNILNPKYFSTDEIEKGVDNLKYALKDFGILQIGKSENLKDKHNISFFRKEGDKMQLIKKINKGSEVDSLIYN